MSVTISHRIMSRQFSKRQWHEKNYATISCDRKIEKINSIDILIIAVVFCRHRQINALTFFLCKEPWECQALFIKISKQRRIKTLNPLKLRNWFNHHVTRFVFPPPEKRESRACRINMGCTWMWLSHLMRQKRKMLRIKCHVVKKYITLNGIYSWLEEC